VNPRPIDWQAVLGLRGRPAPEEARAVAALPALGKLVKSAAEEHKAGQDAPSRKKRPADRGRREPPRDAGGDSTRREPRPTRGHPYKGVLLDVLIGRGGERE